MFIGYYELENEQYNNIYYKNKLGYKLWNEDTFSPDTKNMNILDLAIKGKTYKERKYFAEEIAKIWQNEFSSLNWSYNELAIMNEYFYKIGKKYGLLKEFKENCICQELIMITLIVLLVLIRWFLDGNGYKR